jgi:4'-phosphopantetheinyl transferase
VWGARPTALRRPSGGDIHLWQASLDGDEVLTLCRACLSADESSRADRFKHSVHRNRFIRARSILRHVLAEYLRGDADEIRFNFGPNGKPELADPTDGKRLHFNLSHSGGVALLGICDRAIGVDVERVCDIPDLIAVARQVFAPAIVEQLLCLPTADRSLQFFKRWTCQEAQLKADGLGLPALANRPADRETFLSRPAWSIDLFESDTRYVAACAR